MKKTVLPLIVLVTLSSCIRSEQEEAGEMEQVYLTCMLAPQGTRSSVSSSDDRVSDMNVYAYRNGVLEDEQYGESAESGLTLTLTSGYEYDIYALANVGQVHAPAFEADLQALRVGVPDLSAMSERGLPMCCREAERVRLNADTRMTVSVERLVGRCSLRMSSRLQNCSFNLEKVSLKQTSADLLPFVKGSAATSVRDGDIATDADIQTLSEGGEVSFYVPENCQGVLLPDNSDPWSKVPSSIPEKSGLCTYIQLEGTWVTSGATAPMTFRMYLGADNCSDFNVSGNSSAAITLFLSDQGTLTSSWKVEMGSVNDTRSMSFAQDEVTVMQGGSQVAVPLLIYPSDAAYTLDCDTDAAYAAGLQYHVSDGILYLSTTYTGTDLPSAKFYLRSWDGRLSDEMTVTVDYSADTFRSYDFSSPAYIGEYGKLYFTDASEDAPVTFSTGGITWLVGRSGDYDLLETYRDSDSGMDYFFLPESNTIYMRPYRACLPASSVTLSREHESVMLSVPVILMPKYDAPDLDLTETGDSRYDGDERLYYDQLLYIRLTDLSGNELSLKRFMKPDELITAQGHTPSNSLRYSEAMELFYYGLGIMVSDVSCSNFYYSSSFLENDMKDGDDNDYLDPLVHNALGHCFVYGLKSGDDDDVKLKYRLVNGTPADGDMLSEGNAVVNRAFPSQRHLGEYMNCQLANGSAYSNSAAIDFTSGGLYKAPRARNISWSIRHGNFTPGDDPRTAYEAASADAYTNTVSVTSGGLSFSDMSESAFPSCGGMCLMGEAVNPHNGRKSSGCYTLDLVLYLTVGVQLDYLTGRLGFSFVPFCPYSTHVCSDIWNDCFPSIPLSVHDAGNSEVDIHVPESSEDNSLFIAHSCNGTPATFSAALLDISGLETTCFSFDFYLDGVLSSSLTLNRDGMAASGAMYSKRFGNYGFYRLERQYSVRSLDFGTQRSGLENYVVEAAYGSFFDY